MREIGERKLGPNVDHDANIQQNALNFLNANGVGDQWVKKKLKTPYENLTKPKCTFFLNHNYLH